MEKEMEALRKGLMHLAAMGCSAVLMALLMLSVFLTITNVEEHQNHIATTQQTWALCIFIVFTIITACNALHQGVLAAYALKGRIKD